MNELAETVLPFLVGPASGLVVTVMVLVGLVWLVWWSVKNVLGPFANQWLTDQNRRFDQLMTDHAEDRKVFREAMTRTDQRLDRIETDITDIKADLRACTRQR